MKTNYIAPQIKTIGYEPAAFLAGTVKGFVNDKFDIGYGGVDTKGSLDPSVNLWNLDEDDENWDRF